MTAPDTEAPGTPALGTPALGTQTPGTQTPGEADVLTAIGQLPEAGRSPLPLWFQVAESLRAFTDQRPPDVPTRLPTEAALARHWDVSLSTVRQALGALEGEGLVSRHRRRGTFISSGAAQRRSLQVSGSVDAVVRQQAGDQVTVLDRLSCAVPPALAEHFAGLDEVVRIRRLRRDSGVPLSYAENFLRPELAARIDDERLRAAPMTQILRDDLGLRLTRIENVIEARNATPRLADLLEVDLLSPTLLSTNLTRDDTGRVVDAALIYYRGDRFRFTVDIDVS
ncbi:MAG TPA: GntR family transcriptional regulator [Pseudonocardia sp.]|nr:GntR family transcriptional regulator [Pseudonocardia sp.]